MPDLSDEALLKHAEERREQVRRHDKLIETLAKEVNTDSVTRRSAVLRGNKKQEELSTVTKQAVKEATVKVYMLDVSNVSAEHFVAGYPHLIPCREGQDIYDLDVVEERLPAETVKAWRKNSWDVMSSRGAMMEHTDKPLGFNLYMLPTGTKLTVVEGGWK